MFLPYDTAMLYQDKPLDLSEMKSRVNRIVNSTFNPHARGGEALNFAGAITISYELSFEQNSFKAEEGISSLAFNLQEVALISLPESEQFAFNIMNANSNYVFTAQRCPRGRPMVCRVNQVADGHIIEINLNGDDDSHKILLQLGRVTRCL